jgi:hypothetical protein
LFVGVLFPGVLSFFFPFYRSFCFFLWFCGFRKVISESTGKYFAFSDDSLYILSSYQMIPPSSSHSSATASASASYGMTFFRIQAKDLLLLADLFLSSSFSDSVDSFTITHPLMTHFSKALEIFVKTTVNHSTTSSSSSSVLSVTAFTSFSSLLLPQQHQQQQQQHQQIKDLFPLNHLFRSSFSYFTLLNEFSFVYHEKKKEWILFFLNSFLSYSFVLCSVLDSTFFGVNAKKKEIPIEESFFECALTAEIDSQWMHRSSLITYAGKIHPFLLKSSFNQLQTSGISFPKEDKQREEDVEGADLRMVVSYIPNTVLSLDVLYEDIKDDKKLHLPPGLETYFPKFLMLHQKKKKEEEESIA